MYVLVVLFNRKLNIWNQFWITILVQDMKSFIIIQLSLILLWIQVARGQDKHGPCKPGQELEGKMEKTMLQIDSVIGNRIECVNGFAGGYPCLLVDQESFVSISDLQNSSVSNALNDIWGWTHSDREFALVGLFDGTSFVDITDPVNPLVLGILKTHSKSSTWRDIKTYGDYAYIVSEADFHGMQIFDLKELLSTPTSSFSTFETTAHYSEFTSAHNIFINEATAFAYVVGTTTCGQGLHIVDISNPTKPSFAGCYSEVGYVHDVQCVIYDGPDQRYKGREICFASDENVMDIIDVTNKRFPELISSFSYQGSGYVHQGWLTEDKKYFLLDDEQDEYLWRKDKTKTIICDVSDLQNPFYHSFHLASSNAIDHNQYVKGSFTFQSNYRAGLRILDLYSIELGDIKEVAFFDTDPNSDSNRFSGSWSNYPYFDSGVVVISDITRGLFIVRPNLSLREPSVEPSQSPFPFISDSPSLSLSSMPSFYPTAASNEPTELIASFNPTNLISTIPSILSSESLLPSVITQPSTIPSIQPSKMSPSPYPTIESTTRFSAKPSANVASSSPTISTTYSITPSCDPNSFTTLLRNIIPFLGFDEDE